MEDGDYVIIEGSMSSFCLETLEDFCKKEEQEILREHVDPIGGNTIPPQYSREISRYQPSDKERTKAMKDALEAVREFTHEPNPNRNGKINSSTMKEMWDYENGIMGTEKKKRDSSLIPKEPVRSQLYPLTS